ncbi:SDR family NAD(P)-dependent oxidoreductase [Polyangium spumosum]|uniref:SDR family NAD(P)-dependent oxidoreductase n=1 Tax=Polyangium spumosum TaxID=889282 RepID=A0A6N7PHE1_9BACT|nr:SDR family NAD(P)-dependent oxidoreductase [Polyangium spumosum]MRG91429.1 SDR family NAD(P)-dependent oxidoreductase [Polyangium spumosum]
MPARGRKVLVTGATDGIGRATAKLLLERGGEVILHGRSSEKVRELALEFELLTGTRPRHVVSDLSSLASVAAMVRALAAELTEIDVLVNNAGVGAGAKGDAREVTGDGHEKRFAVNYLAPVALTELWLSLCQRPPRVIVNVASAGQEALDFDDLMTTMEYEGLRAYRRSKLALVMWTFDLAQKYPDIAINALHPGSMLDTKIVRETFGQPWGKPEDGARAIRLLIERSLSDQITGEYFDVERPARANAQAYDDRARAALRRATEALLAPVLATR